MGYAGYGEEFDCMPWSLPYNSRRQNHSHTASNTLSCQLPERLLVTGEDFADLSPGTLPTLINTSLHCIFLVHNFFFHQNTCEIALHCPLSA